MNKKIKIKIQKKNNSKIWNFIKYISMLKLQMK